MQHAARHGRLRARLRRPPRRRRPERRRSRRPGKSGHQPCGASFAFNNANELPLPLDNRTNDFDAGVEWANPQGHVPRRRGTDRSSTTTSRSLIWDNPIRVDRLQQRPGCRPSARTTRAATATATARRTGRMSLAPSNTMNVVSVMGLYKMAGTDDGERHAAVHEPDPERGAASRGRPTRRSTTPTVLAAFPHLARLPREHRRGQGQGRQRAHQLQLAADPAPGRSRRGIATTSATTRRRASRPTSTCASTRCPRRSGSADRTSSTSRDRPSTPPRPYSLTASALSGRATATTSSNATAAASATSATTSSGCRTTPSPTSTSRSGRRSKDRRRRGDGFVESGVDYEGVGGTQPGLRYYDEADRDRTGARRSPSPSRRSRRSTSALPMPADATSS